MPYLFTCTHCQTKTLVDDRYSGQSGRCVTCGAEIRLPDFAPPETRAAGGARGVATRGPAAWQLGNSRPMVRRLVAAAVVLVLVICGSVAMVRYGSPALTSIQTNRLRVQSIRNIERIASALNAYAADHGTYPPPVIRRPDGTLMHSWRVLVLPYLDQKELFNDYDMNQPWDSPSNLELTSRMPAVYRAASSQLYGSDAAYFLITGPGTLFPPAPASDPAGSFRPLSPGAVSDDHGQTLLVVEASSLTSNYYPSWLEPHDLDVTLMQGVIGTSSGREMGGVNVGGAVVATVDGRSHFLSDQTSPSTVMALITVSGGEPLADDVLDR
ncbi:MAG TPA: hypothetical protein DDZ51_23220 [Planctomycetaceae bacterium]|nr:hypothetical protein [Planctomycetaceae bacterium]